MGQEISQQANQQQPHQQQQQSPNHKRQPQPQPQPPRKSFYSNNSGSQQPIYATTSNLSSSSSTSTNTNNTNTNNNNNNSNPNSNPNQNYRLRHKYNLSKQTYERTKILAGNTSSTSQSSDTDSNYAKLNSKYLQRSCSQSSDSGIYNSSCHCSSVSSLSAVSSSSSRSTTSSTGGSSRGCPSSLVSSKSSNRSLDKQKHYLSHHLYIKSYLDILEEDERARAHFKSARPGGIRNYTPKILASSDTASSSSISIAPSVLPTSAPASAAGTGYGYGQAGRRSSVSGGTTSSGATSTAKHCQEDPWI